MEILPPPPKQKISDETELLDYQQRKRKTFEDNLRKNRMVVSNWVKYAQWEESQKEMQRARSIWERAIDNDHRNITIWLKYAEMEMKNRQINHARNLWDRAVTTMPRVNQFWYKYTYFEEMLENIQGARQVFERWMEWQPDEQAWNTYINFELRYGEIERARNIFDRYVLVHPDTKNWIKFAKFEVKNGYINKARSVFERSIEFFGNENLDAKLLLAFAKFEEEQHEFDRVKVIYKYGLENLPKERTLEIYNAYSVHEKKYGDRVDIEDVILSKRKHKYEQDLEKNPSDYDCWFDYLQILENEGDVDIIRDRYERAIANIPPTTIKDHWRRYIYLWINYALFEELHTKSFDRVRQVFKACLELIPHKTFTFGKIWLLYANFEIRCKNIDKARKILGTALGMCGKEKIFRGYIDLEIQLREFDRCRILYEKFIEYNPENCVTWMKFAELENLLGDVDRVRSIFELAVSQQRLNMPEILWKAYIDFEVSLSNFAAARNLYERLLNRTNHIKVWLSLAMFEVSVPSDDGQNIVKAREVFEKAYNYFKFQDESEHRVLLLESWREFEKKYGSTESLDTISKKMPQKVLVRRKVTQNSGEEDGWEEAYEYVFPEDNDTLPNNKLLEAAKQWKLRLNIKDNA